MMYHFQDFKWKVCNQSNCCPNDNKHKKKQEGKSLFDHSDKAFKPCPMHGPKSNHTFKECYKNPKTKTSKKLMTKIASTSCTTTMRSTQVKRMSCMLVWIGRSQVRTSYPSQVKTITKRTKIIIFKSTNIEGRMACPLRV
jgi:hypothetical protein